MQTEKIKKEATDQKKREASQNHRDRVAVKINRDTPVQDIVATYNVSRATAYRAKQNGYLCPTYHLLTETSVNEQRRQRNNRKTTTPKTSVTERSRSERCSETTEAKASVTERSRSEQTHPVVERSRNDRPQRDQTFIAETTEGEQQLLTYYDQLRAIGGKTWKEILQKQLPHCYDDYMDYYITEYVAKPCPHHQVLKYAKAFATICAFRYRAAQKNAPLLANAAMLAEQTYQASDDEYPPQYEHQTILIGNVEITNHYEVFAEIQRRILEQKGNYAFAIVWAWARDKKAYRVPKHVRQILDKINLT